MKIGKFGQVNNITVDTIRHYMDMGLLVPEKKGGQYYFDDNCQKDLEMIMEFKTMGFSLNEIKTVLIFKNLGMLAGYEENAYFQSLFNHKYEKIAEEIAKLSAANKKIKKKIEEYNEKPGHTKVPMGIDISYLSLLCCPKCGEPLTLENGTINRNQIIEGELACHCRTYKVEAGILITGTLNDIIPISNADDYISEYILNTDPFYLETLQKGLQTLKRKITGLNLESKVILEPGTGVGFLLRTIYDALPDSCIYIAVDHNIEKQKFLKGLLERTGIKKNILFICSDFSEIPIKKHSTDIIIDHAGTSNYSFEHTDFLLEILDEFIKKEAYLLGTYLAFKNFSTTSKVLPQYRDNFIPSKIRGKIEALHFELLEETTSDLISKGGRYEDYFVFGEEVFNYLFIGKR
ncbi:MerR family transcriptional regulator [Ureibacillus sinduriensis]|uniref:Methyltransferase n=1 Tax=Ureibacillus sinduriensis BLB-1 = JCM 15800 TaxID=1384057 RepID=A0A0A3HT78_9BACL|nr:MerR family transcriptional regulator [Ureibacillus sinduriensis]KGR75644.1 methyltransferase [Ureibacillus sinduriensis BLB-1 = JCM 15800]